MILLIDDIREGGYADIVARNADAGIMVLDRLGKQITELHIDFDLGNNSYNQDGLSVLKFALKNNCLPNIIWIVSLNPPGRKAIIAFLLDNGYKQIANSSKFERRE